MNAAQALHTAARRYCAERYGHWMTRYAGLDERHAARHGGGYTPEALDTFPRYILLNAVRDELERIDPDELADFAATRARLVAAGRSAGDVMTLPATGATEYPASVDERAAFCRHVAALSPADVAATEPLPYRRVLGEDEARVIWAGLAERWGITSQYWYPLSGSPVTGVAAFREDAFDAAAGLADALGETLAQRGVARVFEFREEGPDAVQDVELFDPCYHGERYWSSAGFDWVVYVSHEGSITVGGWLLAELEALWPECRRHVWDGPF